MVLASGLLTVLGCGGSSKPGSEQPGSDGGGVDGSIGVPSGGVDPNPHITFTQVGKAVGINRSIEPPSAGVFSSGGTLIYGSWLADLDGDGRLDYFGMNHGQYPHLSGLFLGNGKDQFGKNLYTVSFQLSPANPAQLDETNEVRFVGDINGDGLVDFFFTGWSGLGGMCINQGVAQHGDWTGPGFLCFGTTDGLAFADVNGDGKIDVLTLDITSFDPYTAYYSQTAPFLWRLNNGSPNIATWPTTQNFLSLRVVDPTAVAAPFIDLNNDGIPDKIVGIELPPSSRGVYSTTVAGQQVFIGHADGTYTRVASSGLETVDAPITRTEDVNDDGCIDIGTDITAYRDNQSWYIQNKVGSTCTATFTATPRTALPYYTGYKRYNVDIDNSGVLSKVVIIHTGYGTNDGRPGGVSIYRPQPDGSYIALTPTDTGINIDGTAASEFYADNISPGDWNDDGRIDLAGTGEESIPNTDSGLALWTSNLATTNHWIKVTLPTVTGSFTGAATIEVFDVGTVGNPAGLVTPPRVLYTGKAWASQVYHFGIGTRSAVDVRVTFPDGGHVVRAGVAAASRISIAP